MPKIEHRIAKKSVFVFCPRDQLEAESDKDRYRQVTEVKTNPTLPHQRVNQEQRNKTYTEIFGQHCTGGQHRRGKKKRPFFPIQTGDPEMNRPRPECEEHHITHHMRGRNQEYGCEESQEGCRERTAAKPLGQSERSDDRQDRGKEKRAVHCDLAEPHERSDSSNVIGAK